MADDMKKVGLIFTAEGAEKFNKSLKQVNAEIQQNRSAFKLARSEWDSSTTAVDKLRTRQEYLSAQTESYSKKVRELEEQLANQTATEGTAAEAISKTKTQLDNAKSSLNNYEKQLSTVNTKLSTGAAQLEMYAEKVGKIGKGTEAVGNSLTKNVSAPLMAVGAAAVASANDLDEGYNAIIKKTGAVGDETKKFKKIFDDVYPQTAADAETVGNAIGDVSVRFDAHGKKLEKMSLKFLQFAKVNNVDASDSIQKVSRYMGDASIPTSKYGQVLDQLTKASQKSRIGMDTLTENLTKYGAPMRALGFTTQESIAMFSGWEKAGVNTEIAFSGMKKSISNWGKEGKDSREEFKKTMKEIQNAPNIAKATTKAIEVFGAKAGPDLADAIKGGRFEYSALLAQIEKSKGAVSATSDQISTPAGKMKKAWHEVQEPLAGLGATLIQTLIPALKALTTVAKNVNEHWSTMSSSQKKIVSDLLLMAIAIGPLISGLGKFNTGISEIMKGSSKILELSPKIISGLRGIGKLLPLIGSFLKTIGVALSANPIGIIVLAIAAVVAALILLWTHCKGFRDFVKGAFEALKSVLSAVGSFISEKFKALVETIGNAKSGITSFAKHAKEKISSGFKDGVESAKEHIKTGLTKAYGVADSLTNGGLSKVIQRTKGHLEEMKSAYANAGGGVKGIVAGFMTGVKDITLDRFNDINAISGGRLGTLLGHFHNTFSNAHAVVAAGLSRIRGLFNFDWHLPNIKLPHFSASGGFSLHPLKVPSFDIRWYKDGGILNRPTIFGMNGDQGLGAGEAGPEAVLPISNLKKYMAQVNAESNIELIAAMKETLGDVVYVAFIKAFQACHPTMVLNDEKVGEIMADFFRKEVLA